MKRELKFRAWHNDEKFMLDWSLLTQSAFNNGTASLFYNVLIANQPEYSIMQFTGLTDKNGTAIYEGDVLTSNRYPYQDNGDYNYHAFVEWIDEFASFQTILKCVNKNKRGISDGINDPMEDVDHFEVIGNIYEHPNLLNPSLG